MATWDEDPSFKIESGASDFSSDGLIVTVHRPENAISRALITANDFDGKNYIATVDAFAVIKVSFRYGAGAYTQVFEGVTERVGPRLNTQQTLELTAFGYGRALRNTTCNANYGAESESPTLDTPHEIWDDLIANHINKKWGGVATGYGILDTKVAPCANPSINYLEGGYRSTGTVVNDLLKIYQGHRNGLSGMHWFVDENKALFINTMGAHENNATGWPTWWRTDQATSTLVEGTDFIEATFHKKLTDFANTIVLYCNLRKPGAERWTEGFAGSWTNHGVSPMTNILDNAVDYVVGSNSLTFDMDAGSGYAWVEGSAGWDLTKTGSDHTTPTINFYFKKDTNCNENSCEIRLFTTDIDNDYYYSLFSTWGSDPDDTWIHRSLPIADYWKTEEEDRVYRWVANGAPDWTDINGVGFRITSDPATDTEFDIDDLHIAGKIIREAYNSTSITAYDDVQRIIRYDVAVDDSLKASDDTGTAGHLAYGELLQREAVPLVGTFTTPLAIDALPGQQIHIHHNWNGATYDINADFRVKEIIHTFNSLGAITKWDVTSDVLNTFGLGFNEALTAYYSAIHTDPDMKNLKTTGLDPYIARYSKDYP